MTIPSSDILIIGAGPAGCAAGIAAVQAGASVCVVDRAQFPRPKTCGDALSNKAVELIDVLGAGAAFESVPKATVSGAAAIFPDGSRVCRSYGERPGSIAPRLDLDNALFETLSNTGATVVQGVHIRQITKDGERISGAEGRDASGGTFRWNADVVIGADGPGSVAWAALGLKAPGRHGMGVAVTEYYEDMVPAEDPGHSEHYFDRELPRGYGWIFPPVAGVANIGVYQPASRYKKGGEKLGSALDDFLSRHKERFAGARRVGKRRSWSLPLATFHQPPAAAGLLTCGDAARLIDPLTGEGIWQALHSGMLAGAAAAQSLGAGMPSGHGGMPSGHGGGFGAREARAYRRACGRQITWPSAARVGVQGAMHWLVAAKLYRSPAVRSLLRWGYAGGISEVTKSVGT